MKFSSTWRLIVPACALILLASVAMPGEAAPLNKEEQARINRAIDDGVAYLKRSQGTSGSWAGPKQRQHAVGYAALPGLTLLECGVAPDEQAIRRVAAVVRRASRDLDGTYEIALSILFLDRLGDPKDREVIQTLAVRLIAGQADTGGWSYKCPLVGKKTQEEILASLRKLDPEPLLPIAEASRDSLSGTSQRKPENPPLEKTASGQSTDPAPSGGLPELAPPEPKAKPADKEKTKPVEVPKELPARLKQLPVFQNPENLLKNEGRGKRRGPPSSQTDNSNTQFAILGMWAAQRHGVPARRTMQLMVRRFESSQNSDGSWGYHYVDGGGVKEKPSMTCVGLLGLAVGHGIARPPRDGRERKPIADERIRSGLAALALSIGDPTGNWTARTMENLYFLWSVERVGVLYGLTTIGDHDWYRWGAEILVANQQKRGYWISDRYPGSSQTIDTCMALLFLKRANLFADLSKRLPFQEKELRGRIIGAPSSRSPGESRDPDKKP